MSAIRSVNNSIEDMFTNCLEYQSDLKSDGLGNGPQKQKIYEVLEDIYLEQTIFRIEGSQVETTTKPNQKPMRLIDCLSLLEHGKVYQVMHMNMDGQLEELNHQPKVSFADRVTSQLDGKQILGTNV